MASRGRPVARDGKVPRALECATRWTKGRAHLVSPGASMSLLFALAFPIVAAAPVAPPAPTPAPPEASADAAPEAAPDSAPVPPPPGPVAAPSPPAAPPRPAPAPYYSPAPVLIYETPPGPRRAGFTIEGSLGLGLTHVDPEDSQYDSATEGGLSGLNVAVGGFVTPTTAITLRIAGTMFTEESGYDELTVVSGFLGPAVQRWFTERAFVGAGLGWGILAVDDGVQDESETGLGLDLRVGYDIVTSRTGALHIAAEVTPTFFDGGTVTGVGFQLGAQLF
jgi:hypothetical protein